MRIIKKMLCILVIFALAVSFVPTSASATGLAVVGTSFSSAGMTSAEFAASAGPYAVGILAAVAAAYGIKAFTQTETGQAVKDFFMGLIEDRAQVMRRSVAQQMEALLGNATINEDGSINLGRLSFAEARDTLFIGGIEAERPEAISSVSLKNFRFSNALSYIYYDKVASIPEYKFRIYIVDQTSRYNSMIFKNTYGMLCGLIPVTPQTVGGFNVYSVNIQTGDTNYTYWSSNTYEGQINIGGDSYVIAKVSARYDNPNIPVYSVSDILGQSYTLDDMRIDYANDTLYGVDETLRDQTVNINEGLTLAPDLINSAVLGGAAGEISASDYCGALVDYVSGYDTVIDGVTVAGMPEAGTVPRSIEEAPTSDTVIDEAPPSTMTGTEAAGLYSFALDELFPFCLPFDFVHLIEKFNVEPEAPNFDWRFYIPGIIDYTLHIDLSAWNSVAAVFRNMVLVAFVIGLIILTREMFIRA